jgi:hypothetical protein
MDREIYKSCNIFYLTTQFWTLNKYSFLKNNSNGFSRACKMLVTVLILYTYYFIFTKVYMASINCQLMLQANLWI